MTRDIRAEFFLAQGNNCQTRKEYKMTKHHIEGLSDDPKYWVTKEELIRDEDLRGPMLHVILNEIMPFHPDRDKCPREILVENLMIDFEMNDTNTLIAIAGAIVELKAMMGRPDTGSGQ